MSLLRFLGKALSPKRRIAALVDAVVDRVNDKYAIEADVKIRLRVVDVAPSVPKVDLDEVAKADD